MISIKMFCNAKTDLLCLKKDTRCEVVDISNNKVNVIAKNAKGEIVDLWLAKEALTNFRYFAWWNGIKTEYQLAKKLAKLATTLLSQGHDWRIAGKFEMGDLKKLVDQLSPYATYYDKKKAL